MSRLHSTHSGTTKTNVCWCVPRDYGGSPSRFYCGLLKQNAGKLRKYISLHNNSLSRAYTNCKGNFLCKKNYDYLKDEAGRNSFSITCIIEDVGI